LQGRKSHRRLQGNLHALAALFTTIKAGESRFPPLHPSLAEKTSHR